MCVGKNLGQTPLSACNASDPEIFAVGNAVAVNVPLPELCARLGELPRDWETLGFYCSSQRA